MKFKQSEALDILLETGLEKYGADFDIELADAFCHKSDFRIFMKGFEVAEQAQDTLAVSCAACWADIKQRVIVHLEPEPHEHVLFFIGRESEVLMKVTKALKEMEKND